MKGFVDLTLIFASPGFEGTVEPLDRLGGHALVVHGVSDVELRLNGAENEVRTTRRIGREPTPWNEAAAAILSGRDMAVYSAILPVKQYPTTPIEPALTKSC
jgi:hypothetical protein